MTNSILFVILGLLIAIVIGLISITCWLIDRFKRMDFQMYDANITAKSYVALFENMNSTYDKMRNLMDSIVSYGNINGKLLKKTMSYYDRQTEYMEMTTSCMKNYEEKYDHIYESYKSINDSVVSLCKVLERPIEEITEMYTTFTAEKG